jgi:hypothetical protein
MKRREFLAGAAAAVCPAPSNPYECFAKERVDDLRTFATPSKAQESPPEKLAYVAVRYAGTGIPDQQNVVAAAGPAVFPAGGWHGEPKDAPRSADVLEGLIARSKDQLVRVIGLVLGLIFVPCVPTRGDTILDFSDVPPGTLAVGSPYTSQGFMLTSTSGGFVFNSPDTGNGSSQTPGNNPFYAGANGLAAFSPGIVTVAQTNGDPFSLLSIDLARDFAFDQPPSTTFTGMLAGGGTVMETFSVSISSPPLIFQTFDFTAITNVTSVSWDQDVVSSEGVHQFGNIHLSTVVPEPSALTLLALGVPLAVAFQSYIGRQSRGKRGSSGPGSVLSTVGRQF